MPDITTREILSRFRSPAVKVREFRTAEPVPHINSKGRDDDSPLIADTPVDCTHYEFEQGTLCVRRAVTVKDGVETVGPIFDLSVQAFDQYSYQREFSVRVQRDYDVETGTSKFRWQVSTYQHPFHTPDQNQWVSAGVASRFVDRLVDLMEHYPDLVFNNSGYTSHAPPQFRPRHEGFVRWHTQLLNGRKLSVNLLD
jgi:hypothetical protein